MSPIKQALMSGYSEDDILDYLSKSIPALAPRISKAKGFGHSASKILDFLSKTFENEEYPKHFSQAQIQHAQREKSNRLTQQLLKMGAIGIGGGALAGRALSNVLPGLSSTLKLRGLPKPPVSSTMPPAAPLKATQAAIPAETGINSKEILEKMGLLPRIENLSKNNPPEIVGQAVKGTLTPGQKTWLKSQTDRPIEQIVGDFLTQAPQTQGVESEKIEESRPKMALLPDGRVGEITGEKQGIADVRLPSGETARRKLSEMDVESPELAGLVEELIESIPEKERSSVLSFAAYNEPENMMAIQFHDGNFYVYPDVSKDQFDQIISNATLAKTSGDNLYGIWTQGEESRGAGFHQVLQQLKESGKEPIKFPVKGGYEYPIATIVREVNKRKKRKRQNFPK